MSYITELGRQPRFEDLLKYRRVVITGVGATTSLGNLDETFAGILRNDSGMVPIKLPYSDVNIGGRIDSDCGAQYLQGISGLKLARIDRSVRHVLKSSNDALTMGEMLDGQKIIDGIDLNRFGTYIGTCCGGMLGITDFYDELKDPTLEKHIKPTRPLVHEPERMSAVPGIKWGLRGPQLTLTGACATGVGSINNAVLAIAANQIDYAIAGGGEAPLENAIAAELYRRSGALAKHADLRRLRTTSRPFDRDRRGFVPGEGGAVFVLESLEAAKKRKANILAEVAGFGSTSDAADDTSPSGEGARRAMEQTLHMAGGFPSEGIVYVNAHGTGTLDGDPVEAAVIHEIFHNKKRKGNRVHYAVSSDKGHIGHLLGAAGAVELAIALKAMQEGVVPHTRNLRHLIPQGNPYNYPKNPRNAEIGMVVKNSFGFGGINHVIAIKPYI